MQLTKDEQHNPALGGQHSIAIRIWHWATFSIMIGSFGTVLIAKTIFSTQSTVPVVQHALEKGNITVSADQAKPVAHDINDILWHWHTYIGYILAALFGFRIIIEFFNPADQKIIPLIKNSLRYIKTNPTNERDARHGLVVKYFYVLFYFALLVQTASGLFMAYSDDIASLKNIRRSVKEVHSVFMWVILGYIILHLGGVLLAELGPKYKGIVSGMINGGNARDETK